MGKIDYLLMVQLDYLLTNFVLLQGLDASIHWNSETFPSRNSSMCFRIPTSLCAPFKIHRS